MSNRHVIITVPHGGEMTFFGPGAAIHTAYLQAGKQSPDRKILEGKYIRELVGYVSDNFNETEITVVDHGVLNTAIGARGKAVNEIVKVWGKENCLHIEPHVNAATTSGWHSAQGHKIYHNGRPGCADAAKKLSDIMAKDKGIKTKNRGIDERFFKGVKCRSILSEPFFMTNEKEVAHFNAWDGFERLCCVYIDFIGAFLEGEI